MIEINYRYIITWRWNNSASRPNQDFTECEHFSSQNGTTFCYEMSSNKKTIRSPDKWRQYFNLKNDCSHKAQQIYPVTLIEQAYI